MSTAIIPIPVNDNPTVLLALYAKTPADALDYTISAVRWLGFFGRTIVGTPQVTCVSSDLTISGVYSSQGLTTFTVAGGEDLVRYPILFVAQLDNGQTLTKTFRLPVQSDALDYSTPTIISQGPTGRGIASITQPGGLGNFVVTYSDSTADTFSVAIATTDQIVAAFAATPSLAKNLLDNAYAAGAFGTSNTGSGGGSFIYGSFLSFGTSD